jgi:hypothetical protein
MNVVSELFASNGCFSGSRFLALSKYATLSIVQQCLLCLSYSAKCHFTIRHSVLNMSHMHSSTFATMLNLGYFH